MRNPFAALFERKAAPWGGTLGALLDAYIRDGDVTEGTNSRVFTDQAMRVAAFASCVRLISANVSTLPLEMHKRLPAGGTVEVATTLTEALSRPNAWQTGQEWREQLTGHLLVRGNGFSWINWVKSIDRDGVVRDRVKELIPLHPDQVEIEQDARTFEVRYFLRREKAERMPLPNEEVFHLRSFSTDGVRGRGIIDDARETIGVALSTQRYARRLFDNDATPGVILKHPGKFKDLTAAERLRNQWDESHRGQARKTVVLEEGMTLDKLTISNNDAQFLETRQMQRSEIAGLFPVPPHLIGDVDRSTSWGTGIEQQTIGYLTFTLLPIVKRWEHAIARALITREDAFFVKHKLQGFMRGDAATRAAFYERMVRLDAMTPNEVRALEDMNPLPDGGDRTWSQIQTDLAKAGVNVVAQN